MHRSIPNRSGPIPGDAWRVILVGRTGLDQALRRDAEIELVRARDSIDALGELSDPIDETSPARTAVVVSGESEPVGEELVSFLAALRRVDPFVRVLRVGGMKPGYDGWLDTGADAGRLREVLADAGSMAERERGFDPPTRPIEPSVALPLAPKGASAPEAPRPERVEAVEEDPHERAMRGAAGSVPWPSAPGDDGSLVRALLAGRSILEPALELAKRRAGREDLQYDAASGRIVCPDSAWAMTHANRVAELSGWLSAWVKLDAQHRELRQAAFTDPLTGAWNRRYFDRFMDAAIEQARRARRSLTLMVFDIDDFKKYNDAYGHAAGDEILIETVRLLNSVIRPSDRVCRVGGDEFAVIFYEPQGPRAANSTPPESVYGIAKRFQQQICNHRFPKLGEQAAGTLTISGGLATFPWDGHDAGALLDRADQLSMESKKQGKNALTFGRAAETECRREG